MRKRDRIRMAAKLKEISDGVCTKATQQMYGAEWYLLNGADGKGLSFSYAALSWMERYTKELKALLKKYHHK